MSMMNFSLSTGNSVFPKTLTLTLALLVALVLDAAAPTVRGVVKDAAGTSLPGVTVLRNGRTVSSPTWTATTAYKRTVPTT